MARGKSFTVYAATETEKQEWILHINRCIQELIKSMFSLTFIIN